MAEQKKEKKKVERQFVSASAGAETAGPARISAQNRKKAAARRAVSGLLWVIALAAEIFAILVLNGRWYFDDPQARMYWLIGLLAADFILVVIGARLWKKANRLDPVSRESGVKFFLWNQMGFIAAIICFVPFIVFLLADKDLDRKTKKIVTAVAAAALVLASALSIDFRPVSSEDLARAQENQAVFGDETGMVYWTRFGKSYHYNPDCQSLRNSSVIYEGTIEEAFEAHRSDPCDFCANPEILRDAAA